MPEDRAIPIAILRRWPFGAAAATIAGLLALEASGRAHSLSGPAALLAVATPLIAYGLGTTAPLASGLLGAALLAVALQLAGGAFNPLFEMITLGPCLAGRVVVSQRGLTDQIEIRNRELAAERTLFALESVRYERT